MMHHVLIVDDSDVDRMLMEGLLGQSSGFVVIQAQNGVQALKKLDEWTIDLILTDLQMPKMDGLELVKAIRKSKLQIPIVLTTGNGSEDIAAQALQAGAAGYIPKNKLNQMLVPTVREVLEIFNGDPDHNRLLECAKVSHFEFELGNDPTLIGLVVDFCEHTLKSIAPLDRIDCLRIAVAVDQAIRNATFRGNLELGSQHAIPTIVQISTEGLPVSIAQRFQEEPFKDRVVNIVMEIKPNGFVMRIRDEGPGFDTQKVADWTTPSSRGTNLIKAFMDKVKYNDEGNEVQLSYRFDRARAESKQESVRASANLARGRLVCQKTKVSHEVAERKFVIGHRAACHLRLPGQTIAPLHCVLVNEGDHLMLLSLTPEFETLVNGKPGNGRALKNGDEIKIGEHKFIFSEN